MEKVWKTIVFTLANAAIYNVILPVWALFEIVRGNLTT